MPADPGRTSRDSSPPASRNSHHRLSLSNQLSFTQITVLRSSGREKFGRTFAHTAWCARSRYFCHAARCARRPQQTLVSFRTERDPLHTSGNARGIPPREEPATRQRSTRATKERPFSSVDAASVLLATFFSLSRPTVARELFPTLQLDILPPSSLHHG